MATDQNHFCQNYLLINPEKAGFFDLLALIFSSQLHKRKFIDVPEGYEEINFRRRWLIFLSTVLQKLFLLGREPLAKIGDTIETLLNLISNNGGLISLLKNIVTGKVVWPEKNSATYASVLGHIDRRIELDKSIKPDGSKYKAALAMMAAKFSYENEAYIRTKVTEQWKMKFLNFHNFYNDYQQRESTQGFMLQDTQAEPNLIVVAFRGTEPFAAHDWITDLDISWYEFIVAIKGQKDRRLQAHRGFMKALGLQKDHNYWPKEITDHQHQFAYYTVRETLREMLQKNQQLKFILSGHNLGAALAILFVTVLFLHEEEALLERLEGVYTFGQPRVGDQDFGKFMKEYLSSYNVKYFRYVYCNDVVPRVPVDDKTLYFKHFGDCLYFNSLYKGKVLEEEPNKNYFSSIYLIPKYLNAFWELIRGFILPYLKGPDYKEGWVLKLWRVFGLFVPGVSAHAPQDYVNSTRLGSLPSKLRTQDLMMHKHDQLKKD